MTLINLSKIRQRFIVNVLLRFMPENILFWLRDDFTNFGIAQKLKTDFDFNLFAIIDGSNYLSAFYEFQNIVNFTKIWNFYDHVKPFHSKLDLKYLSNFEKKYNLKLSQYVNNESSFSNFKKFSSNEILSILQHECELFESIIEKSNPTFFVAKDSWFFETELEPLHHFQLFCDLCLSKKIKILLLNQPHLGNKSIISEKNHTIDYLDSLNKISDYKTIDDLQNYLKSHDLSKQNKDYVKRNKISLSKKILKFSRKKNSSEYFLIGRSKISLLFYYIKSYFIKKNRKYFIDKYFNRSFDVRQKYVYFPLSVDNEKEILFSSPLLTNQFEIIRNIARSLPIGYKLLVKEHPNQSNHNWRSVTFYKKILNLPNVFPIHPSFSTKELFENSSLVITISGSSGFEAAFFSKPSLLFSSLGYAILSSVGIVNSFEELSEKIKHFISLKIDNNELCKYISELEKNCFEFDSHGFYDSQKKCFSNYDLNDLHEYNLKMKSYLEKNSSIFNLLSTEFNKKILQHNGKNKNNGDMK
jgi:hypothetical protein